MGKSKTLIFASLLMAFSLSITACSVSYSVIKKTIGTLNPHDFKDGTYTGSSFLLPVSVKAEVTVKSGRIESIRLLRHFNGHGKPAEKIIPSIIEKQSLDVDVIAGATHSSLTILKAVEAALKKGR
jgi:uncharacterized protein with FMN-binding domain